MVKIDINEDQVDRIVIDDLKDAINSQLDLDKDEGGEYLDPDYKLINAIKVVLDYYMSYVERKEFFQELEQRTAEIKKQIKEQYNG